ncbi:hypothetical protein L596_008400 [Steinernema carpocapsae]|uniref:C2H2-type domain-containing protein n=1 Tax=Steinernema carpocapsae TaxID=34508 RepID=A0A4U5PCD1_STECR|nr:hypothetical protein L596_008400 [Steinernema carpocapsae]
MSLNCSGTPEPSAFEYNESGEQDTLFGSSDSAPLSFVADSVEESWLEIEPSISFQDDHEIIMGFDEFGQSLYFPLAEVPLSPELNIPTFEHVDEIIDSIAHNVADCPSESVDPSQLKSDKLMSQPGQDLNFVSPANRKQQVTITECQYCGVVRKHPSKIQAHLRTHTGERPFVCEICGQRFTQQTPLRNHVKRHVGDTPFQCSYGCGKSFVSNSVRKAHELRIHFGVQRQGPARPHLKPPRIIVPRITVAEPVDRPPLPPVVEWKPPVGEIAHSLTSASKRMDDVISAVASGTGTQAELARGSRKGPLVTKCEICGLLLKHPSKIQAHLRTHTGERPFKCPHCNMSFSTKNPLKVHILRMHSSNERPFQCTWECGRKFVSHSARKEHERVVHEGIKRYQCAIGNCRRLFTRRCYLLKHHASEHHLMAPPIQGEASNSTSNNPSDLSAEINWNGDYQVDCEDFPEFYPYEDPFLRAAQEPLYSTEEQQAQMDDSYLNVGSDEYFDPISHEFQQSDQTQDNDDDHPLYSNPGSAVLC